MVLFNVIDSEKKLYFVAAFFDSACRWNFQYQRVTLTKYLKTKTSVNKIC